MSHDQYRDQPCNLVIIGASGDLTRRKLLPALFSLYCREALPHDFRIIGFSRSELTDAQFRELMMATLTCRYEPGGANCAAKMDRFLARCVYVRGEYAAPDSFKDLCLRMRELSDEPRNTLYYLAIPPSIFTAAAAAIQAAGVLTCEVCPTWSRVVVEKPFGRDTPSAAALLKALAAIFSETQTYRIDHYLGKEVIQNLLVLRFANAVFEPLWSRHHIDRVTISWAETLGCAGRAGYFDQFGIIRDVVQNHLLQVLALVAMEPPVSLDARDIADEKVKLLRSIAPVRREDTVIGQYAAGQVNGRAEPGYRNDPGVARDSLTPTYARLDLRLPNPRWHGVPFVIEAGKALNRTMTEIRIQFRAVPYSIFSARQELPPNALVIRVQPEEAIELQVINKRPGLSLDLAPVPLDFLYRQAFPVLIPDAYERLLLDVLRGDQSLFPRADEIAAAWDVVTPLLHDLEAQRVPPVPYPFGSAGPA